MTLDLAYLLDFKALAETGSFSRAAFVRNVTQPATAAASGRLRTGPARRSSSGGAHR